MRFAIIAPALAILGLAAPASAMPFPPLAQEASSVTLAAYGCGPGWTRGPYGHCHPMGYYAGPRPYAWGYAHPYYRHCWWRAGVRVCN